MTPEEIENIKQRNYELGISAGYEKASLYLRARSQDQFSAGNDKEATMLRDLANQFKSDSKDSHPGPP